MCESHWMLVIIKHWKNIILSHQIECSEIEIIHQAVHSAPTVLSHLINGAGNFKIKDKNIKAHLIVLNKEPKLT